MVDSDEPANPVPSSSGPDASGVPPTTPQPGRERSRPSFLRRWSRRLAVAGIIAVLTLGALYLSRDALLHPALCRLATWAGERAGYEVRLGTLRTDWWTELAVEDVEVRAVGEGDVLRELVLDRAHADFAFGPLLRGDLAGLRSVDLGRGHLELDVRDAGGSDDSPEAAGTFELPAKLPPVTAESIGLRLETSAGALEVDGLTARVREGDQRLVVDRVAWSGGVDVEGPASLALRLDGDRVEIRELEVTEVVRDGAGTVDVSRLLDHGEVATTFDFGLPAGGRVEGRLSWADEQLHVDLADSSIHLAPTIAATAATGLPTPGIETLEGLATIRGQLVVGSGDEELEVRVTLDGRDVVYEARRVERLDVKAIVREDGIEFERVAAAAGTQELLATDAYLPYDDLLAGLSGQVQLDLDDLGHWLLGPEYDDEDESELPPHRVVLSATVGAGRVEGIAGRLAVAGGEVRVRNGGLDLAEPSEGERLLALDLAVDVPDLAALGALLGSEDCSGNLTGDVTVDGPLAAPVGHAQLTGESVALAGVTLGRVRIDAEAEGNEVRVALLEAESEDLSAKLSGGWDLTAESFRGATLELEARGTQELGFDAGGSVTGRALLDGPWFAPTGSLSLGGDGLAIRGTPLEDFALEARAVEGRVTLDELRARTEYGSVRASGRGSATRDGAAEFELTAFELESQGKDLRLTPPFRVARANGRLELGRLELSGTAGTLVVQAAHVEDRWTGHLTAAALRPDAFLRPLLPVGATAGVLDLDVRAAEGEPLEFEGHVTEMRLDPDAPATEIDLRGRLADETLELDELALALGGTRVLTANGRIPLPHLRPDDPLELEARSSLTPDLPLSFLLEGEVARLSAETSSELSLRGSWSRPVGSLSLRVRDLTVAPAELLQPYVDRPASLDMTVELADRAELTNLVFDLPARVRLNATGALDGPLDLSRVALGDLEELLATALQGDVDLEFRDPVWMRELIGARRLDGRVEAEVRVAGTVGEPALTGSASVREGLVKYAGVPQLEGVTVDLDISGSAIEIRDARGLLGSSEVTVTGRATRNEEGVALDFSLAGENVLLQRARDVRLRGDLALELEGPVSDLLLSGEVHLVNSRILQQVDFLSLLDRRGGGVATARRGIILPTFRSGPLSTMQLDVELDSRDPVSLTGNVARGALGLDLHVGGTGEVIVPTGTIFLDDCRVALPGGRMQFDRGLIRFRETDPYVPLVELNGEARLAGYDVEMRLEGPIDDLEVEPSTYPALDRQDALLLLLTGQPPVNGAGTTTAAQSLGLYLAKDLARRWASNPSLSDADDQGLLSRLEIVSGQDVSRSGAMTIEVSYRAYENVLRDDDAVFVVAERDVHEDYNIGLRFQLRKR